MGEQPVVPIPVSKGTIGVLSETLRLKLTMGLDNHPVLLELLNNRTKIKILGGWQATGKAAGKTFVQFSPIEGKRQGKVFSVCEDHIIILNAGPGGPAEGEEKVAQLS